ncbi:MULTISPECIES: alpha/beta hydrolase family protein [unclassified Variovorax]|uniref:alpha/beta hydrolase family protein n=1 Tax=Variovorax atrisoli TaxID=3394203 RepID=UPI000F7E04F8|nr:alpha/beta fold hydrolase [Variovorax sp. 369]RTD96468.1 alpha/beta fold hydrolase [Variovorax sp. 369]
MPTRRSTIDIPVDGQHIEGTLFAASTTVPGVLLVHGWDGSQEQYAKRANELAALGCVCLTFDLRGHARHAARRMEVTREDNLRDVLAAYDALVSHPTVDPAAIAIVGSSYGGYLAALVSAMRPVRWLALRAPALYRDGEWDTPKGALSRSDLVAYRRSLVGPKDNRALAACAAFAGDVLIVESEHDQIVPHPVVENYLGAFKRVKSVTYRVLSGADHALSKQEWRQAYGSLLVSWLTEMTLGAQATATMTKPVASATA